MYYMGHNKHKTQRRGELQGISLISEKKTKKKNIKQLTL